MANFSRDLNLLEREICWVIFRFPDDSLKMIRTTLRADILEGLEHRDDALYDLDFRRWLSLDRVKGSTIEIYTECPELEGVDLFANKFIT